MRSGLRRLLLFVAGVLFVYGALVALDGTGIGWVALLGAVLIFLGLVLDRRGKHGGRR
ncbi:hypothetical protein GCM10009696_19580 [Kocuria himachalensis]